MITNEQAYTFKEDFPIFSHVHPLVYLDNAATTHKPSSVINAVTTFYSSHNANVHRGIYPLSEEATEQYEKAHAEVGTFLHAGSEEIIFTRGTTESLNLLSYTLPSLLDGKRDEVVLTAMEHHSNLVPWQQLCRRTGMKLKFIPLQKDLTLDYEKADALIGDHTALVSATYLSNAIGVKNDVKKLSHLATKAGALSIIDAAQAVPHMQVNVKDIGCDFLAFSGHKMCGPTGIGGLFGRKELLQRMQPFHFGGDMINSVSYESATWNTLPMKFEAGTPHVAGALGLMEAIRYLNTIGLSGLSVWEKKLVQYALEKMEGLSFDLYSPRGKDCNGILSFNLKDVHAHDLASLLGDKGICIRGGHHCTMPLMQSLGIAGSSRASFFLYNTYEDVDQFVEGLKKAQALFNNHG